VIASGHPATMRCLESAGKLLEKNSNALCLIGGIDSLLALDTLNWFEEAERLKSETFGRNQSFSPGEAVGFMIVETEEGARRRNKKILAKIAGIGSAKEPAPFLSEQPSKGEGLTQACRTALSQSGCSPKNIEAVWSDLNGEFFRSKEWGYAEFRCFGNGNDTRQLWHPADCMGSAGAASGAILINMATVALARGWIKNYALVFCSDDEGERGAVVLKSA
jgi:3-oxoacyl-[acyl-carrier-protein] synthase-1